MKLKKKNVLRKYSYTELREYKAKVKDKFAKHIFKVDKLLAKAESPNKIKKPILG